MIFTNVNSPIIYHWVKKRRRTKMKNMIVSCHNHNGPKKSSKRTSRRRKRPLDCGLRENFSNQHCCSTCFVLFCLVQKCSSYHDKINHKNDVEGVGGSKYWRLQQLRKKGEGEGGRQTQFQILDMYYRLYTETQISNEKFLFREPTKNISFREKSKNR